MILFKHNKNRDDEIITGDEMMAQMTKITKKQKVIQFIAENDSFTRNDVLTATGANPAQVSQVCTEMIASGALNQQRNGKSIVYSKQNVTIMNHNPKQETIPVADRFRFIEKFTKMVATGIAPSFLLTGGPGIGKTYSIVKVMNDLEMVQGDDYVVIKGHSSPLGLYRALYENQDKIVIFDDTDSVFKCQTSTNILKAALDSYNTRIINWNSLAAERNDMECEFEFTGSIIFISNIDSSRLDSAVVNRCITANLSLINEEIMVRIEDIMPDLVPQIDIEKKREVISFMKEKANHFQGLSIRTFIQACKIREGEDICWREMILYAL